MASSENQSHYLCEGESCSPSTANPGPGATAKTSPAPPNKAVCMSEGQRMNQMMSIKMDFEELLYWSTLFISRDKCFRMLSFQMHPGPCT